MSCFRFIILWLLLNTFMGAANGIASTHHHDVGHELRISSSFEKEHKRVTLHCILNKHQHGDKFCPHSIKKEKGEKYYLSAFCHGSSKGTSPSFSFHKDNIDNSSFISGLNNISFLLSAELFLASQHTQNLQNPPPEVL